MANHELFDLRPLSSRPNESTALFPSHVHEQLFLVRLLDFVKEKGDERLTGVHGSCLTVLSEACNSACFDEDGSIEPLQTAVAELLAWLSYAGKTQLWLPTLDVQAELEVTRQDFLFIAANHSKHNLSRLTGVSNRIAQFLQDHGYEIEVEEIPLALDDFREHLGENYFIYYGTWLAELVNNIAWGIWDYLRPLFLRSYIVEDGLFQMYSYTYPAEVSSPVAQQWFWRLMNHVRSKPYLDRFHAAESFKEQCSLEWAE